MNTTQGDGLPLFTYLTFIRSRAAIIPTSNVDMRWQGVQSVLDWQTMGTSDGFGVEFKNKLRNPGGWTMRLQGNGEMLPNRENQVALSATQKDKWGIPKLHFNCKWSDNETAMVDGAP